MVLLRTGNGNGVGISRPKIVFIDCVKRQKHFGGIFTGRLTFRNVWKPILARSAEKFESMQKLLDVYLPARSAGNKFVLIFTGHLIIRNVWKLILARSAQTFWRYIYQDREPEKSLDVQIFRVCGSQTHVNLAVL